MLNDLPENIYSIALWGDVDCMPTKKQANNRGKVLWYAKGHGWYMGNFQHPYMDNTSHWTYAPDDLRFPDLPWASLGIEPDTVDTKDQAFETWIKQYPEGCFDPSTVAILKLGYLGGWRRGNT